MLKSYCRTRTLTKNVGKFDKFSLKKFHLEIPTAYV